MEIEVVFKYIFPKNSWYFFFKAHWILTRVFKWISIDVFCYTEESWVLQSLEDLLKSSSFWIRFDGFFIYGRHFEWFSHLFRSLEWFLYPDKTRLKLSYPKKPLRKIFYPAKTSNSLCLNNSKRCFIWKDFRLETCLNFLHLQNSKKGSFYRKCSK